MTDNDDNAGMTPAQSPEAIGVHTAGQESVEHKWTLVSEPLDYLDGIQSGLIIKKKNGSPVAYLFNASEAALATAAPDLLEALIQMEAEKADYMRINNLGDPAKEHTNKLARAAIARATGAA